MIVRKDHLELMQERLRARVQALLIREFVESGITIRDLSQRLGKSESLTYAAFTNNWNWKLGDLSDFLFAIRGGELSNHIEKLDLTEPNDALEANGEAP